PYQLKTRLQHEIVRIICEVEPERPSTAVSREEEVLTRDGTTRVITPEDVARKREGPLEKLRRRLRGELDNILLKALQKAPRRRYASVEQFSEDLQRYLDGMPVIARPDTWRYRASRFVGRHRVGVATAALILLLLIGGVAGTTWQWRKARAAESVAERRAEQFGKIVDSYIDELKGALKKTEGGTAARRVLAATALKASEQLQSEGSNDPVVRRKLARVFMLLGEVQGGVRSSNEGAGDEALASFDKALNIRRELAASARSDATLKCELASSHFEVGTLLQKSKRDNEALNHYHEAQALSRSVLKDHADDREASRILSAALINEADALVRTEKLDDARKLIEESVLIRRHLAEAIPQDPVLRRDLSTGEIRLGRWYETAGQFDAALSHYHSALSIREKLRADKADATSRRDVVMAHESIGRVQMRLGQPSEADRELRLALKGAQELSDTDSADQRINSEDIPRIRRTLKELNHGNEGE
ncbi:MAG TPA: tetratricopeptide repeat protein, partial [Phycisphaerae bacterium]|nr:tetratricopeptide repeat protein [Phycisphaerae bacterium]